MHSAKRRKPQNKTRLLFQERLQPSNASIVPFMFRSPPLFFGGHSVFEVTTKKYICILPFWVLS